MVNLTYSADTQYGSSTVLNKMLKGNYKGTTRLLRSAVTQNDASNPSITSGIDLDGWKRVIVWVDGTMGTQWNLTPLAGDTTIGAYFPLSQQVISMDVGVSKNGTPFSQISRDSPLIAFSTVIISNDAMISFDVSGCDMFNVRLDNVKNGGSGTSVSVYATPSN